MIDAIKRIREGNRRNTEAESSKKHRHLPYLPSIWRPKRDPVVQRNVFIQERSQKEKISYQDFLPLEFEERDHDSSVDKVQ